MLRKIFIWLVCKSFKWLFILGPFLALGLLALLLYLHHQKEVVDRDSLVNRIVALEAMLEAVDRQRAPDGTVKIPQSWDAGLFVPHSALDAALEAVVDQPMKMQVSIPKPEYKGEMELVIKSVRLRSKGGNGLGRALLEVRFGKGTALALDAQIWCGISHVIPDPKDAKKQRIVPVVRLSTLMPTVALWDWFLSVRGLSADLMTTPLIGQINERIAKALEEGVPLPVPKLLELGHSSHLPADVKAEGKGRAKMGFDITAGPPAIPMPWKYDTHVMLEQGLWLLLSTKTPETLSAANRKKQYRDTDLAGLEVKVAEVEAKWAQIAEKADASRSEVKVWVGSRVFETMTRLAADLKPGERTVTLRSSGATDNLYYKEWRDKYLGKGGVSVRLERPDSFKVDIIPSVPPQFQWSRDRGLTFTVPLQCKAEGTVHFHVDPLIGGGAGAPVGIGGETSPNLDVSATLAVRRTGGSQVLCAMVKNGMAKLGVTASTDGRLVTDWGWTKVPRIAVEVVHHCPTEMLPPLVLCDDAPLPTLDLSLTKGDLPVRWATPLPAPYLGASLHEMRIEAYDDGMMAVATPVIKFQPTELTPAAWKKRREQVQDDVGREWEAALKPEERGGTEVNVSVGGVSLGEIADIVGFLRSLGHPVEEIVKQLGLSELVVTPEKVTEWLKNPSDSFRRSDAGKAARQVEEEAKRTAERIAKEAERAAQRAAEAARQALRDAESAVKKADKWRRKTLGF